MPAYQKHGMGHDRQTRNMLRALFTLCCAGVLSGDPGAGEEGLRPAASSHAVLAAPPCQCRAHEVCYSRAAWHVVSLTRGGKQQRAPVLQLGAAAAAHCAPGAPAQRSSLPCRAQTGRARRPRGAEVHIGEVHEPAARPRQVAP